MTNRALVLSALADGPVEIVGPLAARDTRLMAEGLRALGCVITETDGSWVVEPLSGQPGRRAGRSAEIDVGNAGTVLRFLPAIAALSGMQVRFTGDPRIAERMPPWLPKKLPLGSLVKKLLFHVNLPARDKDGKSEKVIQKLQIALKNEW